MFKAAETPTFVLLLTALAQACGASPERAPDVSDGGVTATHDAGEVVDGGAEAAASILVALPEKPETEEYKYGARVTFTVALSEAPTADVTVGLSSSDEGEGVVDVSELVFTPDDWGARKVTVRGVDDFDIDEAQAYFIELADAVSDDARYDGAAGQRIALTNLDDDIGGIELTTPDAEATTEAGGQLVVRVQLHCRPTHDVTLPVSVSPTSEAELLTAPVLTFQRDTWNVPQDVVLKGVDDAADDGDQPVFLQLGPARSEDQAFASVQGPFVFLNLDDDAPGAGTVGH